MRRATTICVVATVLMLVVSASWAMVVDGQAYCDGCGKQVVCGICGDDIDAMRTPGYDSLDCYSHPRDSDQTTGHPAYGVRHHHAFGEVGFQGQWEIFCVGCWDDWAIVKRHAICHRMMNTRGHASWWNSETTEFYPMVMACSMQEGCEDAYLSDELDICTWATCIVTLHGEPHYYWNSNCNCSSPCSTACVWLTFPYGICSATPKHRSVACPNCGELGLDCTYRCWLCHRNTVQGYLHGCWACYYQVPPWYTGPEGPFQSGPGGG